MVSAEAAAIAEAVAVAGAIAFVKNRESHGGVLNCWFRPWHCNVANVGVWQTKHVGVLGIIAH